MKFFKDSVPERGILPSASGGKAESRESKEVTEKKYGHFFRLMDDTFEEVYQGSSTDQRPTLLDFHGLPPLSKDIEEREKIFLKWISTVTGLSEKIIKGGEEDDERKSQEEFALLSLAYYRAREFLKDTLKYPDELVDLDGAPKSLSSKDSLFQLLERTAAGADGQFNKLRQSVNYCRLIKATIIAYEAIKEKTELLQRDTVSFESDLIGSRGNDGPFSLIVEKGDRKNVALKGSDSTKGTLNSRGKTLEGVMLRFLNRPELNAAIVLSDGVATRFTLESNEKAVDTLEALSAWLIRDKGAIDLRIEDKLYFNDDEFKFVEDLLYATFGKSKIRLTREARGNFTSMGEFKGIVIKTEVRFEEKKKDGTVENKYRKVEIQIVSYDNKNEKGKMHHSIYDVQKRVSARTRLDGACPESVFKQFLREAALNDVKYNSDEGKYQKELEGRMENIKRYLLEGDNPIVETKRKNVETGEYIYVASQVYSRWIEIGWLDNTLATDFLEAKSKQEIKMIELYPKRKSKKKPKPKPKPKEKAEADKVSVHKNGNGKKK